MNAPWQSEDDPVPFGDVHDDTFSSDYSPSALDRFYWLDVLNWKYLYLHLLMRVFLLCLPI
jgi:hypothetical protein